MREAEALRRFPALVLQQRHRHPVRHRVEQRDAQRRALLGTAARDDCLQHGLIGVHARRHIRHRHADAGRGLRSAGHRGKPALGLHQQVVGFSRGVRAALAEARDRTADQFRVIAPQTFDREAELADRAGLEVLDEHVGLREQFFQQRLVGVLRQIENDRFLAAIEPDEIGALALGKGIIAAREIALRPLDLDDARTGIAQPA